MEYTFKLKFKNDKDYKLYRSLVLNKTQREISKVIGCTPEQLNNFENEGCYLASNREKR